MDDFYFTDKNRSRNDRTTPKTSSDRFTQSDYHNINDNPSLKKRESFKVNIPKEDIFFGEESPEFRQRTRQAKKDTPVPPAPSRTPKGSRVQSPMDEVRKNDSFTPVSRTPQTPSRTPQGTPASQKTPSRKGKASSDKSDKTGKRLGSFIISAILLCAIVAIGGIFFYGMSILGEINYDDSTTENSYVDESTLNSSSAVTNILVLGSDARTGAEAEIVEGERADTMILFSIDKQNKQIKLSSFLRDSYVYIPQEEYYDKLNAAFSYGGPQLTMDTLEYNFGVSIDNYVIINFTVFTELVDLLGGVTVDISEHEADYMVNDLNFKEIKVGENTLSGKRALWYCRMRYLDDDFNRTERQRKFIKAFIAKAAKTNPIKLMSIVKQVVPNISTDIDKTELLSLGINTALSILSYDIVQQQVPANGTWWDENIGGSDVIALDEEMNREILKKFIFEKYDPANPYELPEDYTPSNDNYDYGYDDYGYDDYDEYGYDEYYY